MLLGITGHRGILAKSIIKYIKKNNKNNYKISLYQHDILDYQKLEQWLKRVDIILHLAAITSIKRVNKNKKYARRVNFESIEFIADFIKKTKTAKKFIFLSSSHVYGSSRKKISETNTKSPISFYGYLKSISEDKIQKNLSKYLIIRLFSYYSKFQTQDFLIPSIINKIKKNNYKKIKIKNHNHIRDISSVDFVAKQICELIFKNSVGIINCGSGKGIKIKDLVIKIAKLKFNKIVELDKRLKTKKITQLVSDNRKLQKITGIDDKDNLFKYL